MCTSTDFILDKVFLPLCVPLGQEQWTGDYIDLSVPLREPSAIILNTVPISKKNQTLNAEENESVIKQNMNVQSPLYKGFSYHTGRKFRGVFNFAFFVGG